MHMARRPPLPVCGRGDGVPTRRLLATMQRPCRPHARLSKKCPARVSSHVLNTKHPTTAGPLPVYGACLPGGSNMAQIGLNHRLSVAKPLKDATRALYEGVLQASV